MRQVIITGERRAEVVERPDPVPAEDWVVVRVTVAPMCTEYKQWLAGHPGEHLGHEAVGEVVAVARPGRRRVGERVVVMPLTPCGDCGLCLAGDYIHCTAGRSTAEVTGSAAGSGTMAQYVVKPAWLCPPVPDDLSDERAALALCALGPSCGALETAGLDAFDTLLVTGLGPVGLGAVVNARYRGARVLGVEGNRWRAARALELGAEAVFDPDEPDLAAQVRALTGGHGADVGLDCSGSPQAHRLLIDAVRRRGQVAFVGETGAATTSLQVSSDLIRKGLTLFGSWHYNLNLYPKVLEVIRHSPLIDHLTSHVFVMEQAQEAFETLAGQETAKVLLRPWR